MKYQETGRFGRITKNLRRLGFENQMPQILDDSDKFTTLKKSDQTDYVETVIGRMNVFIGEENTNKVLFECGAQCCGKSWSDFALKIWKQSTSLNDFFIRLNEEEKKYNTFIEYHPESKTIIVERSACICGLINKGKHFTYDKKFCNCSIGHMSVFFNTIFSVTDIQLVNSIFAGAEKCRWLLTIRSESNYRMK